MSAFTYAIITWVTLMLYDPYHLAVNRLTYWQHFMKASKLSFYSGVALLFGLIHVVCPFVFPGVFSYCVDEMADLLKQ